MWTVELKNQYLLETAALPNNRNGWLFNDRYNTNYFSTISKCDKEDLMGEILQQSNNNN